MSPWPMMRVLALSLSLALIMTNNPISPEKFFKIIGLNKEGTGQNPR